MKINAVAQFDILSGNGEMRALMRTHGWAASPLGNPESWPQALRTVVSLMLDSKFPMFVAWGPALGFLYNDAYREILGAKHPAALGRRFQDVWGEIWSDISPLIERAVSGEASFAENMPLVMVRKGYQEQTWFTFSYSPLRDERGAVAGMYCACTETTAQVLADRRQAFQLQMADMLRGRMEPHEITAVAAELLGRHLSVARVSYGEIDETEETVRIARGWTAGSLTSFAGEVRRLEVFGPAIIAELRAGGTLRLDDITADQRSSAYADGYASIGTRALLVVPLIREERFKAILYLAEPEPRRWTDQDVAMAEDVAERTWATVERARAEEDRRRAEDALTRQLAAEGDRLRTWFEQAPGFMAVLRGPDHAFELANAAFMRLVGQRDLLGKPVREALPDIEGQGFFELLDRVFESAQPFFAREASVLVQLTPGAAATERFVDFVYQPVVGADGCVAGIFCEGYDVTERRHATDALRESEARYRTLIENISVVVWRADGTGAFVTISDSWAAFTGQDQEQYLGLGWLDAVHPEDRTHTFECWSAALAALTPYEATFRLRRHDGQYRDVVARGAPVWTSDGQLAEWIGNCTDVTEARRAEEALRTADRRKDEFLAMLAHELRNPLAPISTAAQLLKLARLDEKRVRQTSEIISRQVDHMTSLVDDLLDVSRVTRGLVAIDRDALDLKTIVAAALEQVRSLIELRRHRLSLQLAADPVHVRGDRTRLVQVIANLLNNAAKYTPEGGEIQLKIEAQDGHVELAVCDNGIGIPPDLLPHVFELFAQGERSPDRSQGGLGLGLALVKSLVELHGGSVVAHSEGAGKGSQVIIRLPRLLEPVVGHEAANGVAESRTPKQALRLMIVDDNADAAHSLAMLLEAEGHEVSVEYQARHALERACMEAPQVLLLDIGLPDMDGYELAHRLRSLPETARSVLIALTGYGQEKDRERSKAAGFDHHLVKPADTSRLLALLADLGSSLPLPSRT